jgi:hypothetical protein
MWSLTGELVMFNVDLGRADAVLEAQQPWGQ